MTAAAARKIRIEEPKPEAAPEKRQNGVWIDHENLPTTLAQTRKKRELEPLERWASLDREQPSNRLLRYADIVLGTMEERRRKSRSHKK
jgi:hypothetical protein